MEVPDRYMDASAIVSYKQGEAWQREAGPSNGKNTIQMGGLEGERPTPPEHEGYNLLKL